jgi:hypothetical protein
MIETERKAPLTTTALNRLIRWNPGHCVQTAMQRTGGIVPVCENVSSAPPEPSVSERVTAG